MPIPDIARLVWRSVTFALAIGYDAWRYLREVRGVAGPDERAARARWLHRCSRRALRVLDIHLTVRGPLPTGGLIVSNHLGYLDIVSLSAALPCVFVSKMEVADWPLFGAFARRSGTLFLDRGKRHAVGEIAAQMREVLASGLPLVFFPEGTSTSGDAVLPFKTSLFEPVAKLGCPVIAAAIGYTLPGGSVRDEIHWWGAMKLVPHVVHLFGLRRVEVTIRFGEPRPRSGDRKAIAGELHAELVTLRTAR